MQEVRRQIRCPKCGTVFQVDDSDYEQIVQQVRNDEFDRELKRREQLLAERQQADVDKLVAEKDAEIARQQVRADKLASEKDAEIARQKVRVAELEATLKGATAASEAERDKAVAEAVSERDLKIKELEGKVEQATSKGQSDVAALQLEMNEKLQSKDQVIQYKDDELERLRNLRSNQSVKLIGETLEQHCENEFNRWRSTGAFKGVYFEKDNEVVGGSKGDYVYREVSDDGIEVLSIMFEMKNEDVDTKAENRHKNRDFFAKLDRDRRNKGCEYAVLVSTLEPESDLYNSGIVTVWDYDKMYVIRPQLFIPMISVLRSAAQNALEAKRELQAERQQNLDITHFEDKLKAEQDRINKNYENASKAFNDAIAQIDATIEYFQRGIKKLEDIKDKLNSSERQLRLADDKMQGLTIRKLTYQNPTMQQMFKEAREQATEESGKSNAPSDDDGPLEPDAVE